MTARYPTLDRSNELWRRALAVTPRTGNLLARSPSQWTEGVAPRFVERAAGARAWDVDGREYVDLQMGVGPVSLGHGHPRVDAAIRAQLERGILFSLPSPLEVEVAELVRDSVPGAERVRFAKTGADVTSAAVRLARAATGRDLVLACGYHGWHDWYVATTDRARGVPARVADLTATFEHGDLDGVTAAMGSDVAAVILEPVVFDPPPPGFLSGLRELCDRHGAVLIFDEIWTGFRLGLGGAQAHFDVRADLVCYSKAIANGMPLGVLAGRRELLEQLERDVFVFTTFAGECLSLAAAKATRACARRRISCAVPAVGMALSASSRSGFCPCAEVARGQPEIIDPCPPCTARGRSSAIASSARTSRPSSSRRSASTTTARSTWPSASSSRHTPQAATR